MNKTALYIKTFQPVHLGNVEDINYLTKEHGVDNLILGIGSSKQHHLFEHPFTSAERRHMLELTIENDLKEILSTTPTIHEIPDTRDMDETYEYIYKNIPPFDVLVTNSKELQDMCKKYGIEYIETPRATKIYGDPIRHQIRLDNQALLQKNLSPSVLQYINKLHAKERQTAATIKERIQPKLATDIIIIDKDWNVTMIERRDDPVGLAFPGGMIEYGQTIGETAEREANEEVTQNITVTSIGACIDAPLRDPRAQTYTFPVYASAEDAPIANDDAKDACKIHISDLYNRRHECVLGAEKIIEQLFEKYKFSLSQSAQ